MCVSKLQMLTTKFENLMMEEDETIAIFNAKLMDIANQAFQISKRYSDKKLVWKTLSSLPKRLEAKMAALEEACDITSMRLDELMGSPQAYEMNHKPERKEENMVLKVKARRQKELQQKDDEDKDKDQIVLLSRKLHKTFRQYKTRGRNFQNEDPGSEENIDVEDHNKSNKRIKSRGCDGFGHFQAKCVNTLKKIGKSLNATWSDESEGNMEDEEEEEGLTSHHITFPSMMKRVEESSRP